MNPTRRFEGDRDHGAQLVTNVAGMAIGSEKYVAFTTYTRSGDPKSTPVWIADIDDGRVAFTTPSSSWKVKRLANENRVQLQPSDGRGRVRAGTSPVEGTAVVVDSAEFEAVRARIAAKYGFQFTLATTFSKVAGLIGKKITSDRAIVITLAD